MYFHFWDAFFSYWGFVGIQKILRVFWYFFILEVPRYILLDFITLFFFAIKELTNSSKYKKARDDLFNENPLVSIIVPGKDEGKHIYKLAHSLGEQTYKNFELIIIDDGSTDDTYLICKDLENNGLISKFLHNDERGGKASAANMGLRFSKGKYIVHIDADCSFDRDAIEKILINFYLDPKVGAVGGNVKVKNHKSSVCASLQAIEYLQTLTMGRMVSSYLGIYRIISRAFGAFRKDALDRIGGWDIGPGLDGDISVKIRKLKYKIVFDHRAICLTNAPVTFKALSKQRLRWSKSLIRFRVRKHKDIFLPYGNFDFLNFISFAENMFFNLILDFLWFFYLINMVISNFEFLMFIIPMKLLLYFLAILLQFFIVLSFSERKWQELRMIIYTPVMAIYTGYYMRIIRTIAYLQEIFFKSSYKDPWNPEKSSSQARIHKL